MNKLISLEPYRETFRRGIVMKYFTSDENFLQRSFSRKDIRLAKVITFDNYIECVT